MATAAIEGAADWHVFYAYRDVKDGDGHYVVLADRQCPTAEQAAHIARHSCQRSRNSPGLRGSRSRNSPPRRSRNSPWGRRAWRTGCGPPTESGSCLPDEVRQEPNGEEDVYDDRSSRDLRALVRGPFPGPDCRQLGPGPEDGT